MAKSHHHASEAQGLCGGSFHHAEKAKRQSSYDAKTHAENGKARDPEQSSYDAKTHAEKPACGPPAAGANLSSERSRRLAHPGKNKHALL